MQLKQIIQYLENICSPKLAIKNDPVGLQMGNRRKKINTVLIALDCSNRVIEKAIKEKCDLIITHHPLFWPNKRKAITVTENKIKWEKLKSHKISVYSLHTNYDEKFLKYELLAKLDVTKINDCSDKSMVFAQFENFIQFSEVLKIVKNSFQIPSCQYWKKNKTTTIKTIAIIPGTGGFAIEECHEHKIDLIITGELKWNHWIKCKDLGQNVITIGHQTEQTFITNLAKKITRMEKKIKVLKHWEAPIDCD